MRQKKNKKAWLRIVEAFVGVMIVMGVLLVLMTRQPSMDQETEILNIERHILEQVSEDQLLRTEVLDTHQRKRNVDGIGGVGGGGGGSLPMWGDLKSISSIVADSFPEEYSFILKTCDVGVVCSLGLLPEHEVFSEEILITSNITNYNPAILKVFFWTGEMPESVCPNQFCEWDEDETSCPADCDQQVVVPGPSCTPCTAHCDGLDNYIKCEDTDNDGCKDEVTVNCDSSLSETCTDDALGCQIISSTCPGCTTKCINIGRFSSCQGTDSNGCPIAAEADCLSGTSCVDDAIGCQSNANLVISEFIERIEQSYYSANNCNRNRCYYITKIKNEGELDGEFGFREVAIGNGAFDPVEDYIITIPGGQEITLDEKSVYSGCTTTYNYKIRFLNKARDEIETKTIICSPPS